jgi:hypothetical protein
VSTPPNPGQPGDPQQPYGQQPQGQQPYGQQPPSYPSAPPPNEAEMRRPDKPEAVDRAFMLWLVAAGIGLISQILSFANMSAITAKLNEQLSTSGVKVSSSGTGAGGAVFGIVVIVIWVAVVFAMRNGANWARIVLTVLGILSALGSLVSLIGAGLVFSTGFLGVLQILLGLISAVVIIVAIVFMFRKESSEYFRSR